MRTIQYKLFSESELGPKLKTERELRKERKFQLEEKLKERAVLSDEEIKEYGFSLTKDDLKRIANKHNEKRLEIYENSKRSLADRVIYHVSIFNPGIPQMLLTTLVQYCERHQDDLSVLDMVKMYKAINKAFSTGFNSNSLRSFRKSNHLTFFGDKQYDLMEQYIQSLD